MTDCGRCPHPAPCEPGHCDPAEEMPTNEAPEVWYSFANEAWYIHRGANYIWGPGSLLEAQIEFNRRFRPLGEA